MKTVLVVDDEYDIINTLEMILSMEGYLVRTAFHGREALQLLAASTTLPDVVLVDAMMPVMDGYRFIEALRADPRTRALPVVLMSAAQPDPIEQARGHWDVYVRKPFDLARLLSLLERLRSPASSPTGAGP
jgi:CheY-like chemotaxis protein